MIPKTATQLKKANLTTQKHSRIMLYNIGRNVGHTETYQTEFPKPKRQNILDPINEPRPTEADRQMPRGTAKNGGRNGVRAKGEGREGKGRIM
jgi:hypothetical protein